jgi:opacity protein-like surface antigen
LDDLEIGQSLDSFHVGAGAEFGVGGGSHLSGQYLYASFGEGEFDEEDFTAGAGLSRHQPMAGFGFRF